MWVLKREKIKYVDDTGRKIISFQLTWVLLLYAIFIIESEGAIMLFNFNPLHSFLFLLTDFSIIGLALVLLYRYNIGMILINIVKSQKGLKNKYFPKIPLLY
jgi:uncharacterized Tic20 family protein